MSFDPILYERLLKVAKNMLWDRGRGTQSYSEVDIVNDLFLDKNDYKYFQAKTKIKFLIRKEISNNLGTDLSRKLPDYSNCSSCKEFIPVTCFRLRIEKRALIPFQYVNNVCLKCETKKQKEYRAKKNNDLLFQERRKEESRKYAAKNRFRLILKFRNRRKTPEYKKYMADYRLKNKCKIYNQEVITKQKYHEKNRDSLSDVYCINQLRTQGITNPSRDQILEKRKSIQNYRLRINRPYEFRQ